MNSNQIRTEFLNYFESKNHDVIKSASLIPHDNTLLFTAAGMVPLKDYFSGNKVPDNPNMASSQKCICLLYTSPSPRDMRRSRMPSSA